MSVVTIAEAWPAAAARSPSPSWIGCPMTAVGTNC